MKKYLFAFFFLFISLLIAGCGGNDNGPSNNNGGGNNNPIICEYEYDTYNGVFDFTKVENCEVVLLIDGKEYKVIGNSFNVGELNLPEGYYRIKVLVYSLDGSLYQENNAEYDNVDEHIKNEYFKISFVDEYGQIIKEVYVPEGAIFSETYFPKYEDKLGVTYSWEYDIELNSPLKTSVQVQLVATYTEYTITYHLNGGKFIDEPTYTYTIKDHSINFGSVLKEGFAFAGWYESSSFTGDPVTNINTSNPKNIHLYAKWIELTEDVKEATSYLIKCAREEVVTYSISYEGESYELAFDLSGQNIYTHSKSGKKYDYVIKDGKYYDYSDMTYQVKDFNKDDYLDPLELLNMANNIIGVQKKIDGNTITYTATFLGTRVTGSITVTDGKLTKISLTDGKNKEVYNITYTCKKADIKESEFKEKIVVNLYLIEIRNGLIPEPNFWAEPTVEAGTKLRDIERVYEVFNNYRTTFGGFYLDVEMTQEVDLDYEVNKTINIYAVDYGNLEELMEHFTFTLNIHCDCKDCEEVASYKDITINDLEGINHFNYDKNNGFMEPLHIVEDGKIIMGWFKSPNKEEGEANDIYKSIMEHLESGKYYEPLVIDLYTHVEEADTIKIREYCGCDLHKEGYYDRYIIKGNYVWFNQMETVHEKDGQRCTALSLNSDLSDAKEGFDFFEDSSLYLVWSKENRVNVYIHVDNDRPHHSYIENNKVYEMLLEQYGSSKMNDKMCAGFYYDKELTNEVKKGDIIENGTHIYLKWVDVESVDFVLYNGQVINIEIPAGVDLNSYNWDQYIGMSMINYGYSNLFDSLYDQMWHSSAYGEYVSIFEFYSDESRTNRVYSVNGLDTIYVGYKEQPTVNIICDDRCDTVHQHGTFNYKDLYLLTHRFFDNETQKYYVVEFYLDENYENRFYSGDYRYYPNDFTIYGKAIEESHHYIIHCNCYAHPNGIDGNFNSFEDATKDCDYGYPKNVGVFVRPNYYMDPNYNNRLDYIEPSWDELEVWAYVSGEIIVNCACNESNHYGQNMKMKLVYEMDQTHLHVVDILREVHMHLFQGAEFEFNCYLNGDLMNPIDSWTMIPDGSRLYCEVVLNEGFVPFNVTIGDYSHRQYARIGERIYLPVGNEEYKVVEYYLNPELTKKANLEKDEYGQYIYYIENEINFYAKVELAEIATFTYVDYEGKDRVDTIYLYSGQESVNSFIYNLTPKFGHLAYVVDGDGNRCYMGDTLKAGNYSIAYEKLEGYITITIECPCWSCEGASNIIGNLLDDGSAIGVVDGNKFIVKSGESAVRILLDYYSWHDFNGMTYEISDINISLTENGPSLDTTILRYFKEYEHMGMPSGVTDPFIFNQDTTLYFSKK